MVVILHPDDYQTWLNCPMAEAASLLRQWHGPLLDKHAPAPARRKGRKAESTPVIPAKPEPKQGGLF